MTLLLEGDQVYNGADDNASGVAAVLQVARAFLATGEQPERTVIFCFLGRWRKRVVRLTLLHNDLSRVEENKGYLNYDMIGRNNNEEQPKG